MKLQDAIEGNWMDDLGQGIVVCIFLRARNEGASAGSRMEEKQACVIAVMGNIWGKGRQVGKSRVRCV